MCRSASRSIANGLNGRSLTGVQARPGRPRHPRGRPSFSSGTSDGFSPNGVPVELTEADPGDSWKRLWVAGGKARWFGPLLELLAWAGHSDKIRMPARGPGGGRVVRVATSSGRRVAWAAGVAGLGHDPGNGWYNNRGQVRAISSVG